MVENAIITAPWLCMALQLVLVLCQLWIWIVTMNAHPHHDCIYCEHQITDYDAAYRVSYELWAHYDCLTLRDQVRAPETTQEEI